MKNRIIKIMALILFICIGLSTLFAGNVTFFGPKQYTRNKGKPVTETDTFACLPNYTGTGFTLRLINGDSHGNNRVSSAVIEFNGVQVMGPSDFNQNVGLIERTIDLTTSNEISVKLNSKPNSFVIIDIYKYIPMPEVTFTANPGTIQYLQSSTLSWNVIYADSISIDNDIGNVESIESTQVSPEIPMTTYTLTAINLGGTTTSQVTVTVIFPVPTVTFSASLLIIQPGMSSTLTWTTFAAHTVTIDPGIGNVELNGSQTVTPADTITFTITALGYGGTQTAAAVVTIDGIPPQINVTAPLDGSYLNSPNVLVKGQVVDSSPVTLKVNGNDVPLQQENYFEVPLQMNEGANTVSLEAVDAAGNSSIRQVQVVVDTIAPQVQITAPQDSAFLNTPVITVTGTLVDANPDQVILNNSLEGVIDGNTFTISNVQLNEGANTLNVEAVDKAGNRSQASVSCTLDTALPVITITEPANNSYFNTSSIWVRGMVQDSSPLTVKVNGNDVPLQGENFETRVSLTEGQNTIIVEAVDAAGNQSQSPVTCILDTVLPVITISEPVNDSYFNTSSIWVKGTVQDNSPLTVKVNGNDVPLQGENFETQVSLTEGQNTINIEAVDAAGNQSQSPVTCILDTALPVITISEPVNDSYFNTPSIWVKGTVQDSSPLTVKLNGNDVPLQGENFETRVSLTEGQNTIIVEAVDAAGNQSQSPVTCILDTVLPVITISEPVNDSYFNTSSIWVKGTVQDSSPLTVKVNGNDVLLQGENFETQVSLIEGQNSINVEAVDAAGNQSQASVTCTLDTASPVIHITSPQDNTTFNEIPITITGTVTEANLLKVLLNNQHQAAIDGNTFTFSQVNLSEGENLLTVTAEDKAGNTGSAGITVTYIPDTDPPEIIITSPQDGVFQNNPELTVSGTVTDQSAISYVKVNGTDAVVEGQNYTAALTLSEGENTIIVEAEDQYQNKQSQSVTVMLDTLLPQVMVTQPEPGTYLNTFQVVVKGEVVDASPITVKINGSPVNVQDNQFETTLALAEGANQVKIAVEDAAGNKSSQDLDIFVDTTAPTIAVSSPQENTITNKDKITIIGTITDENPLKITLAGTNTGGEIIGNHFYFRDIPLQEGENTFELVAEDRAGNTNQLQFGITIIKDTVIPQLTILSPVTGSLISQRSTLVTGTVSDDHLKEVRINGAIGEIIDNEFNLLVILVEGDNTINIAASDRAGNVKTEAIMITVDTREPLINITSPRANAILNTPSITVSGRADDSHLASVKINGQTASLTGNEFILENVSLQEGENTITVEAVDTAGSTAVLPISVTLDTAAPSVAGVVPADQTTRVPLSSEVQVEFSEIIDENTLNNQTFYLQEQGQPLNGTLTPGDKTVVFKPDGLFPDDSEIVVNVTAGLKDLAGNALQEAYTGCFFTRDTTPPNSPNVEPLPETTGLKKITVSGTAETGTTISVAGGFNRVDSVCDDQGNFSIEVPLKQGQLNQLCVTAADAAGNESIPACISIYQESTEFAVLDVQFENNEIRVTFSKPIDTTTLTSDNFIVSSANGPESGTISTTGGGTVGIFSPANDLTSQPIMVEIKTGVTDTEGNGLSYPFAKVFNQEGGEVIAQGEVYDDLTGLPLGGAIVKLVSVDGSAPPEPAPTAITTKEGKYVIILPSGQTILGITKQGYSDSHRVVLSASGFSSSVFDSRITPVNIEEKTLLPQGGSLSSGGAILVYPDGAVDIEKTLRITAVGPQSLQGRLPSGWSPLAAFDLRIPGSSPGGSGLLKPCQIRTANQWAGISAASLILAHWDETAYKWKAVSGVSVSTEDITGKIETPGQYAFLIKDTAPAAPPQPVIGEPIAAVQQGSIPTQITAALDFDPALIYPGDTSSAVLTITSSTGISSGVPLQAKVNENYELLVGSTAVFVPYTVDLTAYNYGKPDTKVEFNLSPNSTISLSELKIGTIKADMVRYGAGGLGVVVGPDGGTVSGDGGAEIIIQQGSVNNPIAVTIKKLEEIELTAQVPAGFELIGALDLSLGGAALLKTAIISLSLTQEQMDNIPPDAQLFIVRLEKLDYELFWILKSQGLVENSSIKSFIDANNNLPFPGVTEGGTYLFLRALSPTGFITGTVLEDAQPLARAMVSANNHEIKAISSSSGNYVQTGFIGSVELTAQNRTTRDQGTGTAEIQAAGEIFTLNITIQKTGPEIAAITPVNDETGVPLNSKITFVFSEPVKASTFNSQNVYIRKGTEQVAGVFKLSTDSKQGEFIPNEDFPSNCTINIIVTTGLQDIYSNGMSQEFTSQFTTVDIIPPEADLSKIKVLIPEDGNAKVTGEPGSVEPGTKVIVYNERTGVAVMVDGEEDGSFTAKIGAELSDKLKITVIDPAGNETVFDNKPFVSADGRRMVVDSSGGEFITPEGLGIKIEAGTFAGPVNVGVYEETDPAILAPVPEGFEALKAIRVDLSGHTPSKAFKLSIPLPAGVPGDAEVFFAREVNVFGEKKLMVVDTTSVINNRIETNSPPFLGCTAAGVYRVIWNRFLQLGFGTGKVMRPDVVVTAGEFVWVCGSFTLDFIMPVYIGKDVTLTVKDIDTGESLYEKTSPGLTMMGQVYDFGGLGDEKDMEPPYLIRSVGIKSLSFDVTNREITSGNITVIPVAPNGVVESITIKGAANTTVSGGRVVIYRLRGQVASAPIEVSNVESDGSFIEEIVEAKTGDRILITVEQDSVPIDQEFVLSFSEPIEDLEKYPKDQKPIKLKEINDDNPEGTKVDLVMERLPSQTEILIRPENQLRDNTHYKFEITGISDQSNIDKNKLSFDAYFRTFRASRTDLVSDLNTVYGSVRYGSYLYVACGDNGINILDVSNPSDIQKVGNYNGTGSLFRAVALYDGPWKKKKLVVVGGGYRLNGYLSILDLTDPIHPLEEKFMFISRTRTSTRQLPEGKPRNIAIIDNYAFVPIFGSGLQVIDLLKLLNGSAHDDCRTGFYLAQGAQEVRAYKQPATEYEPARVIAVLLEDRYGVHIIDFTNAQMPMQIGNYLFGSTTRSGSLELAMDYPVDLNEDGKYEENEKKDLLFFSMIPYPYVFVVDITDVVEKQPVDLSDYDYLIKKIKIDQQSADYVYNMDINAVDKTLAVTDSNNGLILLDMNLALPQFTNQDDYIDDSLDRVMVRTGPRGTISNQGLIWDKDLNMAYLGQSSGRVEAIKLGNPRIKLVYDVHFDTATHKLLDYKEVIKIAPSGIKDSDNPGNYPDEIYVMAFLPGGISKKLSEDPQSSDTYVDHKKAVCELWSLNSSNVPVIPWDNEKVKTYFKNLELHRLSDNPYYDEYNIFLSKPIRVTIDPDENRDIQYMDQYGMSRTSDLRILSGDIIWTHISGVFITEYKLENYISVNDSTGIGDRKFSIRADLIDRKENFDFEGVTGNPDEKPNSPTNNPSIYSGVLLHTGEFVFDDIDLHIPGRGFDFVFNRTYRSQSIYSGVLGWGWDHNYNKRLLELPGGDIIYYDGTGRRERYAVAGQAGNYTSPAGRFTELKKMKNGTFRHIFPNRTIEFFDPLGRLIKIQDRNQNKMEFYYNLSGQLSAVMDTMGRIIEFEYNPPGDETTTEIKPDSGRLINIRDFSGREVKYQYKDNDEDNGDLLKVDFEGRLKQYTYSPQNDDIKLAHNLQTYTNPKGNQILKLNYDNDGKDKVTSQDYGGSAISFTSSGESATVIDGNLNQKLFTHDTEGHAATITEGGYLPTIFTYLTKDGKNEGLIKSVTYPEGNGITYDYYNASKEERRSGGNLLSITETPDNIRGTGGDPKNSTSFSYENYYNQVTSITYPNTLEITHDRFDQYGNVEKIITNMPGIESDYTYSRELPGQLESESTPWGTTHYKYHAEAAPGGKDITTGGRALHPSTGGYLKEIISPLSDQYFNEYNAAGNLTNYSNSRGIISIYTINSFNEVEKETVTAPGSFAPLNFEAQYTYDNNGNMETKDTYFGIGDNRPHSNYVYTYTPRDMLETETEATRGTTFYGYDKNDNFTYITDPENNTISFGYNPLDLISAVTIGTGNDNRTLSYEYDGNGNMKESIDPYGHHTFYEYDGYDRLKKMIDPLNNVTIISRAEFGNMLTIKHLDSAQELLRETITVNDPLGRMTSYTVKVPEGDDVTYTYGYADGGKTIVITDSLGRISTVMKNEEDQVIKEIDAAGNVIDYYYLDGRGNMTKKIEREKRPDGSFEEYITEYSYNSFNKIEEIKEHIGEAEPLVTTFTYDVKGNLTGSKDAEGNIISHDYDNFGRRIKTIKYLAAGQKIETKFTYYKNNQLETIEDAKGNITRYEYDNQNRLTKIIYPDETYIEYTYDRVEIENSDPKKYYNRVIEAQRDGKIVKHYYDEKQRLMKKEIEGTNINGTTFEDFQYDGLSRLTKAINDFSTVEIQYDPLNRITQETQMGELIKYTYQNLTESKTVRQTIRYPNQRIIERDFDLLNRISKIKEGNNNLAAYEYIGRTYRLLNKQYNNGDVVNYLFDQGRRLTNKEAKNGANLINRYVYGYNKVHMKTFEQRGYDSDKGDIFGYDEVYRLTNVKFNAPDPTMLDTTQFEKSKTYQFDKVDNIMKIIETQNQTINEITTTIEGNNVKLNQYTTFDQWGLDYDANGNTTQKGGQNFYYDYRNQLVSAIENGVLVNFKYDAMGRRIEKGNGSKTVKYFYSGNQVIEERDGSDNVLKQYIYGNGIDEILRMDKYTGSSSTPYYFHTNAIGSVTAITDQDGNLVERVSYDTFGMPTFTDYLTDPQNPQMAANSIIDNDILFHGRRYDKETNLYYYRARYYDPIMGRFLQTDPMGYQDSMNLYQGFNMNPVNFIDPMGNRLFIAGDRALALRFLNEIMGVNMPGIKGAGTLRTEKYIPEGETPVNPDMFGGSGDPYMLSSDPLYCLEAEEVKFNTKPQQINHTLNAGAWLLNLMISDSNNNYILGFGNFYPSSESLFTEIEYYGGGTRPLRRRRSILRYLQNNLGDVVNIDWKYDTRRPNKPPHDLPPQGVDSVVWFSQDLINQASNNELVYGDDTSLNLPLNEFYFIVFHELLESYLEVVGGLQYNDSDSPFYLPVYGYIGSHELSVLFETQYLRRQRQGNRPERWLDVTGGYPQRRRE